VTVGKSQPKVPVRFDYDDESDHVPYPIPGSAKIEDGSDHHLITELIGEAWRLADFAARSELVPRIQRDEELAQIEVVWGPADFALKCGGCGKLLEGRWTTLADIVETARACSTGHE